MTNNKVPISWEEMRKELPQDMQDRLDAKLETYVKENEMKADFEKEVSDCHSYLASGGLGEVMGAVRMYAAAGHRTVQNDTALEFAILELAQETIMRRTAENGESVTDEMD